MSESDSNANRPEDRTGATLTALLISVLIAGAVAALVWGPGVILNLLGS